MADDNDALDGRTVELFHFTPFARSRGGSLNLPVRVRSTCKLCVFLFELFMDRPIWCFIVSSFTLTLLPIGMIKLKVLDRLFCFYEGIVEWICIISTFLAPPKISNP